MNRALTIAAAVLVAALGGCACPLLRATTEFSFSAPWSDYEAIEVRTCNGSVELQPTDAGDVRVEGRKTVGIWSLAEHDEALNALTIRVGPHPDRPRTLLVQLEYPEAYRQRSPGASFSIRLPQPCAADVQTGNGSVHVTGLRGPVHLDTSNGRIEAERVKGDLRARTSNGAVLVRDVEGPCVLETSNGRIEAEAVRGDLEVSTSNGAVVVDVTPPENGRIVLHSSNGGVRLRLPVGLAADLDLATSNGRVSTDLGEATLKHVDTSKRRFRAEMNGGGTRVEAVTSNGSVTVELR